MARMPAHRALSKVIRRTRKTSEAPTEPIYLIDKAAVDDTLGTVLDFEVKKVDKNPGYLLTRDELELLAKSNHLYITKQTPSSIENVTWAWLSKRIRPDVTGILDDVFTAPALCGQPQFDGVEKDAFLFLSGWLQKQLGRDVEVYTQHFGRADYNAEGPFRIMLWGSAFGHDAARVPARIWDIPLGSLQYRTHGIRPNTDSDEIRVALMDGSFHVADVFPNALYLHFDITRSGNMDDLRIYFTTLQKTVAILNNKDAWPTADTITAKHRAKFLKFVDSGLQARTSRNKHALDSARQRVQELRQMWFEAERDVFALEQSNSPEVARQRFADEFTRLRTGKVKHIRTVSVSGRNVIIQIEDICIKHPRTKAIHQLGDFEVSICPAYGALNHIHNKTRVGGGDRKCHHPHVFDGSPCVGNIADELSKYLAHFEIEATCNLLVGYLQSVSDDHIQYLNHFPTI